MKAFLLLALALANLPTGAHGSMYSLGIDENVTTIKSWFPNNITYSVVVEVATNNPSVPHSQVLAGADCNPKAAVKTTESLKKTDAGLNGNVRLIVYEGTIANASAAPSMLNSDGVPSFCVRVFYNASAAYDSNFNHTTINEIFVSFNYTKIMNDGEATFAAVGFNNLTTNNVTDYRKNHTIDVGVEAARASPSAPLPSTYQMGETFYLCAFATATESMISSIKNVTCSNDGSSRILLTGHSNYDALTSTSDPTKLVLPVSGSVVNGTSKMKCVQSVVTAGFFSGKDLAFNCSGTAVTGPSLRRLEAGEGRFLQSPEEEETTFATTFSLDKVQYDTLTASASFAGAGLSIASVILAMMI